MIFEIKNGKAKRINTKDFKNELELHQLIDKNLEELFEIRYIKDEHVTKKHGRIETLGLDSSNRPVVIEYKKTMEKGQLSQANRYVMWIRQHPDAFELLVRKNLKIEEEIDFSNPRIICFAQDYNIDDKCLALALGAELWKYQYYENNTLVIVREEEPEQLVKTQPKSISNTKREKNQKESTSIQEGKKEVRKLLSVEESLSNTSAEVNQLFEQMNERILELSSEIERYSRAKTILYKTSVNFMEVQVQKHRLRLLLRTKKDQITDPKQLTQLVPANHGWGNLTRIVFVDPKEINTKYSLDDIIALVLQSFKSTQ
jgi:predicted transport protein